MAALFNNFTTATWVIFVAALVIILVGGLITSRHVLHAMDGGDEQSAPNALFTWLAATPLAIIGMVLLALQGPILMLFGVAAFLVGMFWFIALALLDFFD